MNRGVVYDLGYTPHDGERLGRRSAVEATIGEGIRRVLGLRRKARKKILPWGLLAIALIPAIVFVGLAFFLSEFTPDVNSPFGSYSEYFNLAGTMVMIFAGLAGPELLIPDRAEGVLAVYSSRPLRASDYLAARAVALAAVVGFFLLLPQMLLYFGFAALDADGFASAVVGNADDLLRIVGTTAVYVLAYGAPAFLIATVVNRTAPAVGTYLAVMLVLGGITDAVVGNDASSPIAKVIALFGLFEHPHVVRDWFFGRSGGDLVMVDAGWHASVSLLVILVIAAAAVLLGIRRYRSEM